MAETLSRFAWSRLERRARRRHDRDLLVALHQLAQDCATVGRIELPRSGTGAIRLLLPTHHVALAGVSDRAVAIAAGLVDRGGPVSVVDGGRYGRRWWLTLHDGAERHHLLGGHLRIAPCGGGGLAPFPDASPRGRLTLPVG